MARPVVVIGLPRKEAAQLAGRCQNVHNLYETRMDRVEKWGGVGGGGRLLPANAGGGGGREEREKRAARARLVRGTSCSHVVGMFVRVL